MVLYITLEVEKFHLTINNNCMRKWVNSLILISLTGGVANIAYVYTQTTNTKYHTSLAQSHHAINISSIFTGDLGMGPFSPNTIPKDDDIIAFLHNKVKGTSNEHVINDLTVGTRTGTSPVDVIVGVKQGSVEYTGQVTVSYTIDPKTSLSSLFINDSNTTVSRRNYWDYSDVVNEKFELGEFVTLNSLSDFKINQIDMSIVYKTDEAIKNRTGTLTLTALSTSSLYSGSATLTFAFAPPLNKVLTVGNLERGYDVNDPTQIDDNLMESAFTYNSSRISDLNFFKNNVIISFSDLNSATFSSTGGSSSVFLDPTVTLSIFNNYVPTPESIFTYSADGTTVTGFTNDNLDLSSYNLLYFPDSHIVNGQNVDIISINKNFDPETNPANNEPDHSGQAYQSLKEGGSLQYLHLPSKLKTLAGTTPFNRCKSFIGNIYIPGSVISMSAGSFGNCIEATSATYGLGCTKTFNNTFSTCSKLKVISFPNTLTVIDYHSSKYCMQTNVDIPESVTTIGAAAFKQQTNNSLETINLGKVNTIGSEGFRNNFFIKSIIANYSTLPTGWDSGAFSMSQSVRTICTVHNNNPAVSSQELVDLLIRSGFPASCLVAG